MIDSKHSDDRLVRLGLERRETCGVAESRIWLQRKAKDSHLGGRKRMNDVLATSSHRFCQGEGPKLKLNAVGPILQDQPSQVRKQTAAAKASMDACESKKCVRLCNQRKIRQELACREKQRRDTKNFLGHGQWKRPTLLRRSHYDNVKSTHVQTHDLPYQRHSSSKSCI